MIEIGKHKTEYPLIKIKEEDSVDKIHTKLSSYIYLINARVGEICNPRYLELIDSKVDEIKLCGNAMDLDLVELYPSVYLILDKKVEGIKLLGNSEANLIKLYGNTRVNSIKLADNSRVHSIELFDNSLIDKMELSGNSEAGIVELSDNSKINSMKFSNNSNTDFLELFDNSKIDAVTLLNNSRIYQMDIGDNSKLNNLAVLSSEAAIGMIYVDQEARIENFMGDYFQFFQCEASEIEGEIPGELKNIIEGNKVIYGLSKLKDSF